MSLAERLKRKAVAAAQQETKANKPVERAKPNTDAIFEALEATRASLRQLESAIIDYTAKE